MQILNRPLNRHFMALIGRGRGLYLIMGGEDDGILCLGGDPVGAGLCVTVSHIYRSLAKNA